MSETPLTVVCWMWNGAGKPSVPYWRHSVYDYRHVNALQQMVARHYAKPHRFVCVCDDPTNIECETIPLGDWNLHLPGIIPGTWTRLRAFAPGMSEVLGPRYVSLDLDCCIVGDLSPIFDRTEPFLGWLSKGKRDLPCIYNASLWMADTEAFPELFTTFDAKRSPQLMEKLGYVGTEQAWMSYKLGDRQPAVTWREGVVSYRFQVRANKGRLPDDARIVFFHGPKKPWHLRHHAWVRKNYPELPALPGMGAW
jgi:hypothetical protein